MSKKNIFLKAFLAGIMIGIGGTVYLMLGRGILGTLLFAVGLFAICTLDYYLFTGKVCYALDNDGEYILNLSFIWLGNIFGTYFVSLIEHFTRQYKDLKAIASYAVETKLNDNLLSIFFLAFLCNILIYLAVEEYKSNKHELGKYLGIIFGVVVFIVCGFEHCVANMYYFSIADAWSFKALLYILVMTLGNACGGLFIPLIKKFIKEK